VNPANECVHVYEIIVKAKNHVRLSTDEKDQWEFIMIFQLDMMTMMINGKDF
jgi:hypothetical protein